MTDFAQSHALKVIPLSGAEISALGADYGDPEAWKLVSIQDDTLQVHAAIEDTPVTAGTTLSVKATGDQDIDAFVLAGSVAVAGGLYAGIAVSGAGAMAENRIATDVAAVIDGNDTTHSVIQADRKVR